LHFEKAFGETEALNIVIQKAPSNHGQEDLVRVRDACACILQPFEGAHPANYNPLIGYVARKPIILRLKPGIVLALRGW
jgi:hypothetical protein